VEYINRILYKVWFITFIYHAQIVYTKSLYIYYIYIYYTSIYILYIYIHTIHLYIYYTFIYILYIYIYTIHLYTYYTSIYILYIYIYTIHLYIYYTIFSVGTCQDGLGSPIKIPTRLYSLQGRDTSLWYTPKIGSGQNLLSRSDSTNSLSKV
jgi:hypothetical protein